MKSNRPGKPRLTLNHLLCFFIIPLSVWWLVSPSYALTVDEILSLKKAGVSEETLQMLLEREREEKLTAQRAGTWKLGDGRTFYTTEGAPSNTTERRQDVYPCIFPQVEAPRRSRK